MSKQNKYYYIFILIKSIKIKICATYFTKIELYLNKCHMLFT